MITADLICSSHERAAPLHARTRVRLCTPATLSVRTALPDTATAREPAQPSPARSDVTEQTCLARDPQTWKCCPRRTRVASCKQLSKHGTANTRLWQLLVRHATRDRSCAYLLRVSAAPEYFTRTFVTTRACTRHVHPAASCCPTFEARNASASAIAVHRHGRARALQGHGGGGGGGKGA